MWESAESRSAKLSACTSPAAGRRSLHVAVGSVDGGIGKAAEAAAVAHQKLRGLGDREHQQPAVLHRAIVQKAGDEVGKLVVRKPARANATRFSSPKCGCIGNMAGKEVGHLLSIPARRSAPPSGSRRSWDALLVPVTFTCTPSSCPTVRLNSCTRRSMGEPACSP